MTNSYIILPGDITGKKIKTRRQVEDGQRVENIVVEIENQPIPEHKTCMLFGNTSAQVDDLTPATGKRIRLYGFYGAYQVDAAFNPSVTGCLAFGTGCTTDKSKVLGIAGDLPGARALIFTMTPMNRLGDIDEIIRFTMATYDAGSGEGMFVLFYNEE